MKEPVSTTARIRQLRAGEAAVPSSAVPLTKSGSPPGVSPNGGFPRNVPGIRPASWREGPVTYPCRASQTTMIVPQRP